MMLLRGFGFLLSGYSDLLRNRRLYKYLIIPFILNFIFFAISAYYLVTLLPPWILGFMGDLPGYLSGFLQIIIGFFSFLISIFATYILALAVNTPFYTLMCESHWRQKYQWKSADQTFYSILKLTLYSLFLAVVKLAIIAMISVLALFLSFLPPLSFLAVFIGFLVMTYDFCDIHFELLAMRGRERWQFFKKHKYAITGFTLALMIISWIPLLGFLSMPFVILGASNMVYQLTRGNHNQRLSTR